MSIVRFFKAIVCGASVGGVLFGSCAMFRVVLQALAEVLGSMDKLPVMTKMIGAFVPDHESMLLIGVLVFALGYASLAWLDEPSPMFCTLHGLGFFVFAVAVSVAVPWVPISQGVREVPAGYTSPPSFSFVRDAPWLLACSIPLVLAALSSRVRWRTGNDQASPDQQM